MAGIIDLIGVLRDIQNKDVSETFDKATDSLEAIRDFLAASFTLYQGLYYYGLVTAVPGANQFTIPTLAGFSAGKFIAGAFAYEAFVFRDAGGAGAAPQGEMQPITAYVDGTGTFTTVAFTAAVAVDDEILILHPRLAEILRLQEVPTADAVTNVYLRDVVGQKADTPVPIPSAVASDTAYLKALNARGMVALQGVCDPGMAPSQTNILCPNLIGYGDDYFDTGYQMIVLRNTNNLHLAPEMEIRRVITYTSGTGLFTVRAFSANVEPNDIVLLVNDFLAAKISAYGYSDAGSGAGNVRDAERTEIDGWWNGQTIMMLDGNARGQVRPIGNFVAATDDIIPSPPFDAAVGVNDLYFILSDLNPIVPAIDSANNYLTSEVIGNKSDTADHDGAATSSLVRLVRGILARVIQIFNAVNAILTLTETGGTLTATGAEQNIYINNSPAGEFEPRVVMVDLDLMQAGDTTVFRVYYRLNAAGGLQLYDYVQYAGADGGLANGRKLIAITLLPNRFGVQVTLQQTAGVNRDYDWDVHYAV